MKLECEIENTVAALEEAIEEKETQMRHAREEAFASFSHLFSQVPINNIIAAVFSLAVGFFLNRRRKKSPAGEKE